MRKSILTAMTAISVVGLSACSEKAQDSVANAGSDMRNDMSSPLGRAGDQIDNGLGEAGHAINEGADKIGAATNKAANTADRKAEEAKRKIGESLKKAGSDIESDSKNE